MKENKQIVEHIFSNSKKMNKQPKQTTETTHKMISYKQTKIDDSNKENSNEKSSNAAYLVTR